MTTLLIAAAILALSCVFVVVAAWVTRPNLARCPKCGSDSFHLYSSRRGHICRYCGHEEAP